MSNLIQNSIKYSYEGVIFIKARCVESLETAADKNPETTFGQPNTSGSQNNSRSKVKMLEIRVRDQGIGIKDPEIIGKMFNRLDIKDNVNQNGIGFGLTISKMIVEQLGGSMIFRNHTNFDSPRKNKTYVPSYAKKKTKKNLD